MKAALEGDAAVSASSIAAVAVSGGDDS